MLYNKYYEKLLETSIKSIEELPIKNGSKILITGSTGLIGSALVDLLIYLNDRRKLNLKLYCASRSYTKFKDRFLKIIDNEALHFTKYDALYPVILKEDIDYIVHAASNAQPKYYVSEPVETMLANIIGMNNLLEYSVNSKVKRLIYLSSSEVYGKNIGNKALHETDYGYIDILDPRSAYPSSKRATETLCKSYIEQHNLDIVISRPGHVYGPNFIENDSRAFSQFIKNVVEGEDIVLKSDGLQNRSYIHSFDVATALLYILSYGKKGEAYNISNKNSSATILQFAECLAEISHSKIVFEVPQDTERKGYNKMENSKLDSTKLESLGWEPRFGLKSGLETTLEILGHEKS